MARASSRSPGQAGGSRRTSARRRRRVPRRGLRAPRCLRSSLRVSVQWLVPVPGSPGRLAVVAVRAPIAAVERPDQRRRAPDVRLNGADDRVQRLVPVRHTATWQVVPLAVDVECRQPDDVSRRHALAVEVDVRVARQRERRHDTVERPGVRAADGPHPAGRHLPVLAVVAAEFQVVGLAERVADGEFVLDRSSAHARVVFRYRDRVRQRRATVVTARVVTAPVARDDVLVRGVARAEPDLVERPRGLGLSLWLPVVLPGVLVDAQLQRARTTAPVVAGPVDERVAGVVVHLLVVHPDPHSSLGVGELVRPLDVGDDVVPRPRLYRHLDGVDDEVAALVEVVVPELEVVVLLATAAGRRVQHPRLATAAALDPPPLVEAVLVRALVTVELRQVHRLCVRHPVVRHVQREGEPERLADHADPVALVAPPVIMCADLGADVVQVVVAPAVLCRVLDL